MVESTSELLQSSVKQPWVSLLRKICKEGPKFFLTHSQTVPKTAPRAHSENHVYTRWVWRIEELSFSILKTDKMWITEGTG